MQQRSIPDRELQACLVGGQHVAVVLVDKRILELGLPLWSDSQPPMKGYTGQPRLRGCRSPLPSRSNQSEVY